MIFVSDENKYGSLLLHQPAVKPVTVNQRFVDAWMTEQPEAIAVFEKEGVQLSLSSNGLSGSVSLLPEKGAASVGDAARLAYEKIFRALQAFKDFTIICCWNYIPFITGEDENAVCQLFNQGRREAWACFYGAAAENIPAPASAMAGIDGPELVVTFLAVTTPLAFIENKDLLPAGRYAPAGDKAAPLFSRGVVFANKAQRILLSAATAGIKGEQALFEEEVHDQLYQAMHNLRILGSQFNLKQYGIHYGFALEDIAMMRVYYKQETDKAFLQRFVPRFLSPSCVLSFVQADLYMPELLVQLEAVYIKKGETETGVQPKYVLEGQQIRTESFEVHVAEHCNLKCRDCCNVSPFNAKKIISIEEIKEICAFVKTHLRPDVFKVAGGEPTLHPQLDELLQVIKASGAAPVVRVVSNGLLLHRMTDVFWQHIDQLTISNYISAPVKPALLQQIKDKARQYEVVLNIKYVEQFNEIFVEEPIQDKERIQEIYNDCWMRHRCLIVRNGTFYKCTRAAYMDEFLERKHKNVVAGTSTYSQEDGIAITEPSFTRLALDYLNDAAPLYSCEYCLGVSGNLRENVQLKRLE